MPKKKQSKGDFIVTDKVIELDKNYNKLSKKLEELDNKLIKFIEDNSQLKPEPPIAEEFPLPPNPEELLEAMKEKKLKEEKLKEAMKEKIIVLAEKEGKLDIAWKGFSTMQEIHDFIDKLDKTNLKLMVREKIGKLKG